MRIIKALLENLPEDIPVRSVLVGAHWTVVCSRHCGMASTLMSNHPHGSFQVRDVGHLHQKSARELAELAFSTEKMEASIGIAAINSLLDVDESLSVEINASEVLTSRGRGKNVALVGHFPFIPQLRQVARQLWVIEQHPGDDHVHGLFTTRYPCRPNPLGISIVSLLSRQGNALTVEGIDVLDGTPLLDIKPYVPDFDHRTDVRVGWYATRSEL